MRQPGLLSPHMWPLAIVLKGQKPVFLQFYSPIHHRGFQRGFKKCRSNKQYNFCTCHSRNASPCCPCSCFGSKSAPEPLADSLVRCLGYLGIKSRAWLCTRQYHFHPSLALCGAAASFIFVALIKRREKLLSCFSWHLVSKVFFKHLLLQVLHFSVFFPFSQLFWKKKKMPWPHSLSISGILGFQNLKYKSQIPAWASDNEIISLKERAQAVHQQ